MTSADVYDFESVMANLAAYVLTVAGLNAATLTTSPTLQKVRPRSEVVFRPGGAATPYRFTQVGGKRYLATYRGELDITSITDASTVGKATHATYRSFVRMIMELDTFRATANANTSSPYQVDFVAPTASSETFMTQDGFELSRLTYSIDFSVKTDAFTQLAATL